MIKPVEAFATTMNNVETAAAPKRIVLATLEGDGAVPDDNVIGLGRTSALAPLCGLTVVLKRGQ